MTLFPLELAAVAGAGSERDGWVAVAVISAAGAIPAHAPRFFRLVPALTVYKSVGSSGGCGR